MMEQIKQEKVDDNCETGSPGNFEIYYFSSSGNSLMVARELQRRLPGSLLRPIVQLLEDSEITHAGECIGFVFPVHGMTLPIPVRKCLGKLDLSGTRYIFATATRGGTLFRGFPLVNKLLKRQHRQLNANFIIDMPSNDPKFKVYNTIYLRLRSSTKSKTKSALKWTQFATSFETSNHTTRKTTASRSRGTA